MKRKTIYLAAICLLLAGCTTHKDSVLELVTNDYDQRPANKAPTLERPAWPNYDTQNENSFAVFANLQTIPIADHRNNKALLSSGRGKFWPGRYTLYRCPEATYVAFDWEVPDYQDWWFFRFTTGSMIIDADTGDQYMLREVEHFPMDQCFWIHGQSGEAIRFVLVYPPLPLSVKRIEFYEAPAESRGWMKGDARRTTNITLEELRPNHQDYYQVDTTKQGRVIR